MFSSTCLSSCVSVRDCCIEDSGGGNNDDDEMAVCVSVCVSVSPRRSAGCVSLSVCVGVSEVLVE